MTYRRCVIALNNMGCQLLEKGCTVQAHATFRDALRLLQIHEDQQGRSAHDRKGEPKDTLVQAQVPLPQDLGAYSSEALRRAEVRMAHPGEPSSPSLLLADPSYEALSFSPSSPSLRSLLRRVSEEENEAGLGHYYCRYHPLRIDVGIDDEWKRVTSVALTVVVLLNFSIAFRRAAAAADDDPSFFSPTLGQQVKIGELLSTPGSGTTGGDGLRRLRRRQDLMDHALKVLMWAHDLVLGIEVSDDDALFLLLLLLLAVLDGCARALQEAGEVREASMVRSQRNALALSDAVVKILFLEDPEFLIVSGPIATSLSSAA